MGPTRIDKLGMRLRGIPRPRELEPALSLLGDLRRIGWFDSFRNGPTHLGGPIPWLTYPAIYWLESLQDVGKVFEYGSGNSTLWWAKRAGNVVAVEHNPDWYQSISARAPDNVRVVEVAVSEYVNAVSRFEWSFDVIAIDGGPDRAACVPHAINALAKDGVVIFDDTHLPAHAESARLFHDAGFQRIDFIGPRPGARFIEATSVFSREMSRWTAADPVPSFRSWHV